MGGTGSGRRWHWDAKRTTDDLRSLDVRRWQRDGLLAPGRAFAWQWSVNDETVASIRVRVEAWQVFLTYRQQSAGADWQKMDYPVALERTNCHLGGSRPWFICPAHRCYKRAAMLYGGAVFTCRDCHQLAYPSQRESLSDRYARKADRIRAKLGWSPGILNGHDEKPKGMHWQTFERLCDEHDKFAGASLAQVMRQFSL